VRVTEAEAAHLAALAELRGVSIPRLLVEAALAPEGGQTATERREALADLFALRRQLSGVATNLNQLAAHANADRQLPADTAGIVSAVRGLMDKTDAALDRVAAS
jgi:hypothetical protein